jgi:hypothetical protein
MSNKPLRDTHEFIFAIHQEADRHYAADDCSGDRRCDRFYGSSRFSAASSRFPDHQRIGKSAGSERSDYGRIGGDAP